MKKILFPTDFSAAAENAFVYALKVADKLGATITTLHVYQLPDIHAAHLPNTLREVYESIDLEEFENFRDSIPALRRIAEENDLGHVPINNALVKGPTLLTILRKAEEYGSDLIIMGTKGTTGLRNLFFGSIAGEVLENANCPVLAVPQEARFDGRIDRIAITTEFAEEEKKALRHVLEFAKLFDAQVYCVNVDTAHTHFYTKRMETFRQDFAGVPKLHFEVLEGNFLKEELSIFLDEQAIDLVAMLTHKRNFLQELFHYSQTKSMAYQGKTPVLSIQAHTLENQS
ncbi:MAG: universal stress protein [Saprospiraceae bacterium]|nr:universal stress protein [Saprospiraceae bacterium]MCB0626289.1 universal stress protein [Saprospiraceae bacterium]MCB0682060.1 universal stress protein [Saprospiraceae bacterium]